MKNVGNFLFDKFQRILSIMWGEMRLIQCTLAGTHGNGTRRKKEIIPQIRAMTENLLLSMSNGSTFY